MKGGFCNMTEINTKEFFGEYVKARKVIAQMNLRCRN